MPATRVSSPARPATAALLDGPVGRVLLRMAAPNVLAVATTTAVTFADAWYVGQLGITALAALALVFPFLTLMQMMAGGAIGGGTTSAVARALGAGDTERAETLAWHALLIAAVMSVLYMTVLGAFARPVHAVMGGSGATLDAAVTYSQIVFGGAAATFFSWVLAAIHRGTGDTLTPARIVGAASLVQVALSGVLTLGVAGLPRLGIAGPATAWVVCQGAAAVVLALHLLKGRGGLRLRARPFDAKAALDILRVAGPGMVNSTSLALAVVVVTALVGRHGVEALAGYGLGARLELMLVPIAFGVGAALTAAVGVNVGAGNLERARRFAWTGAGFTLVVAGLLGITVALAPHLWLDLFTADPAARAVGAAYLAIAAPFYGAFGAGQTLYFASQGTGDVRLPVTVSLIRLAIVVALGALGAMHGWDRDALFATVALGLVLMGLGQAACLFSRPWQGGSR